jgi:hypothetical protein
MCAECRLHGGLEIRGLKPRVVELIVQRDYFSEEPGDIG